MKTFATVLFLLGAAALTQESLDQLRHHWDYNEQTQFNIQRSELQIRDGIEILLNAAATRDRIVFLANQLSFKPPEDKAIHALPVLVQPPWPKQ